jgi:hypothetical protein
MVAGDSLMFVMGRYTRYCSARNWRLSPALVAGNLAGNSVGNFSKVLNLFRYSSGKRSSPLHHIVIIYQ